MSKNTNEATQSETKTPEYINASTFEGNTFDAKIGQIVAVPAVGANGSRWSPEQYFNAKGEGSEERLVMDLGIGLDRVSGPLELHPLSDEGVETAMAYVEAQHASYFEQGKDVLFKFTLLGVKVEVIGFEMADIIKRLYLGKNGKAKRPDYGVTSGTRRVICLPAAVVVNEQLRKAGVKVTSWTVFPSILGSADAHYITARNLAENNLKAKAKGVKTWELIMAISKLLDAGYSRNDIARDTGVSPGVAQRLTMVNELNNKFPHLHINETVLKGNRLASQPQLSKLIKEGGSDDYIMSTLEGAAKTADGEDTAPKRGMDASTLSNIAKNHSCKTMQKFATAVINNDKAAIAHFGGAIGAAIDAAVDQATLDRTASVDALKEKAKDAVIPGNTQ